jgi:hypothetical protein
MPCTLRTTAVSTVLPLCKREPARQTDSPQTAHRQPTAAHSSPQQPTAAPGDHPLAWADQSDVEQYHEGTVWSAAASALAT